MVISINTTTIVLCEAIEEGRLDGLRRDEVLSLLLPFEYDANTGFEPARIFCRSAAAARHVDSNQCLTF